MKLFHWYGTILTVTALTVLLVYVIPSDSPFVFLTYFFGFVFVTIVPGYCLTSILFASKENSLDKVEEVVLSVALSFGVVGLIGMFLGLSPLGISFESIRASLVIVVLVLLSLAYLRKRQIMRASGAEL